MSIGRSIDSLIAPWAPRWAAQRMAARIGMESAQRAYDAATPGRKTKGWKRPATSADAENARAVNVLANSARDLVRNNPYAETAIRQLTAQAWGDGIAPMMQHPDKAVQKKAQDEYDRWAESRCCVGTNADWYGHGKLATRSLYVDGGGLTVWRPDKDRKGPDGRVQGLEIDHLDQAKTEMTNNGGRIVQGVQFDADGDISDYWLLPDHPGDVLFSHRYTSAPVAARDVDHVYEALRFGQTRGVSRLASRAMMLRDIADVADAKRLQEKVAACVAMVLSSTNEGGAPSPLGAVTEATTDGRRQDIETITPGMIIRPPAGVTASSFTPAPANGGHDLIRQQLAAVSAGMVPYHVMTGDVSQANYSGLRASFLSLWSLLDDDQQNTLIPLLAKPAADRRMRRLAMETGDRRYLEVTYQWALPVRRHADPVKDLMAEIMEVRAGLKLLTRSLADRGINAEEHLKQLAALNTIIDELKLALETDPRRLTDSGVLQAAAGYLAKGRD